MQINKQKKNKPLKIQKPQSYIYNWSIDENGEKKAKMNTFKLWYRNI